jgi:hypothetical protein
MARAGAGIEGRLRQPRNLADLALRRADRARTEFAVIADDLEFIMVQLSKVLPRRELAWVAAGSFAGGAMLATLVNLGLTH